MAGPHGEILPLPVSALAGSFFNDYFVPGAILFVTLGLGSFGAAARRLATTARGPLLCLRRRRILAHLADRRDRNHRILEPSTAAGLVPGARGGDGPGRNRLDSPGRIDGESAEGIVDGSRIDVHCKRSQARNGVCVRNGSPQFGLRGRARRRSLVPRVATAAGTGREPCSTGAANSRLNRANDGNPGLRRPIHV